MYLTVCLSIHLDTWVASPFFVNNAAVNIEYHLLSW